MNLVLRIKAVLALLLVFSLHSFSQTTNSYTNASTWTVPAGINTIMIRVYGGGGGTGGKDCGDGCTNAAAGPVGYVYAIYSVNPGDVIGIYPGGKGGDGSNNVTNTGGGAGGVSTYNTAYNGGKGGNAGNAGASGGGGGGGAASIVTINSVIKIVAGGAGGGGGMANMANSGKPGNSATSPNGTSNTGGNGEPTVGDGGGGGGGGGGHYGSVGGTVYSVGLETAGYGGYRGDNLLTGESSSFTNGFITWTNAGKIEITYHTSAAGGAAGPYQSVCSSSQITDIGLSNFFGTSVQWQYSDDNSTWNNIPGATSPDLTKSQIGDLTATRHYRAIVNGSLYSTPTTISFNDPTVGIAPSGSGTALDPYLISGMNELSWIAADASRWDKHYKQTAHIDASITNSGCYYPGSGWKPIGNASNKFTGSYDGQGYSISNLYIKRDTDEYVGFFGYLSGATITDLNISGANITGGKYIGMLSAYADSQTNIAHVVVSGNIRGNLYDSESVVGGLIGWFSGTQGSVDNAYANVNAHYVDYTNHTSFYGGGLFGVLESECRNSQATGSLVLNNDYEGNVHAGGFAGSIRGQVSNCSTTTYMEISDTYMNQFVYAGGFAGSNSGDIHDCNSIGDQYLYEVWDVTNAYWGGFIGYNNGRVSNSYTTKYMVIYFADFTMNNLYIGGFSGYNDSTIVNSYANSYFNIWEAYYAGSFMGGFTGVNNNTILNCYSLSEGHVYINNGYTGGFAGKNYGQIINSYSAGNIYNYGYGTKGGLVGSNSGTITNSFYDRDNSEVDDDGSGHGKASWEMRELDTFFNAGWDLKCETLYGHEDVWRINSSDNNGYPTLFWQNYAMGCPEWVGTENTDFETYDNWGNSFIPAEGMDIVISDNAVNDLILPQNWHAGNITFNGAGKLIKLNNYNITLGGTVTGADASNYIQTNGSGVVKKELAVGDTYHFPVGNSSYNPVTITNNTLADDEFTVHVLDEVYANGSNGSPVTRNRVQRTWNIGKTNPNSGSGIDFVFNWNNGETQGTMVNPALFHYGTDWSKQTGGSASATSFSYAGYTGSFSPFSIMDGGSTLPVSWLSFIVQKQNNTSLLKWSTATEENSEKFIIQHSSNGASWNVIGAKAAAGNSSSVKDYSFIHTSPVAGMNYYRILQLDKDGRETYSQVVSVNFDIAASQLIVYPNPVTAGQLKIRLAQPASIRIFNNSGLMVMQQQLTAGEHPLNVSHLAKGIYNLKTDKETITFVIQ
jgi:hypothetical protein